MMSVRKRKGPGEKGEMVEDDEVGEEIENELKRVDAKEERGTAMPPLARQVVGVWLRGRRVYECALNGQRSK